MPSTLNVTHLSHDLAARKSYVSLVWADDPAKRLGLEVPFGTAIEEIEVATRQALVDLSRELDAGVLSVPAVPGG